MADLIKDLRLVNWKNRLTTLIFDSDIRFNKNVQKALLCLRDKLIELGADPYRKDFPHTSGSEKVGLDDFLNEHGKKAFADLPTIPLFKHHTITGADLMKKNFPPMQWIIEGLFPIGLVILAGPPKVGKSWLVLSVIAAVTTGTEALGFYETKPMDSLYLALEDTPSRLKKRIEWLTAGVCVVNDRSHFANVWERVENGGLAALEHRLDQIPNCKIVFIDTFAKMRLAPTGRGSLYHEDYEAASVLKEIADRRGICIVIVHHLRKATSDDYMERISGSSGITGAADTIMVLVRDRKDASGTLFVTGRDVEEQELALKFEKGIWTVLGDASFVRVSEAQAEILEALKGAGRPLSPKDISSLTGKQAGSLPKTLDRMMRDGLIEWHEGGKYTPIVRSTASKFTRATDETGKGNNKG